MVVLSQFKCTLMEFPGTLPGLRTQSGPHVLHTLLTVRIQEHHDGIPLSIVQPIHCVRSNVQHCMFFLQNTYKDASSWFHGLSSVRLYNYHNPPAGGSSAIQIECVHSCIAFCAFVCVRSHPVDYLFDSVKAYDPRTALVSAGIFGFTLYTRENIIHSSVHIYFLYSLSCSTSASSPLKSIQWGGNSTWMCTCARIHKIWAPVHISILVTSMWCDAYSFSTDIKIRIFITSSGGWSSVYIPQWLKGGIS